MPGAARADEPMAVQGRRADGGVMSGVAVSALRFAIATDTNWSKLEGVQV